MEDKEIIIVDGIKWWVRKNSRTPVPLCPSHNLRLSAIPPRVRAGYGGYMDGSREKSHKLECAEGPHRIDIPREYGNEKAYVINRIDALVFSKMPVLNLDEEAILVAKDKLKDPSNTYWVRYKFTESKSGTRLILWAGDRAKKNKSQLFIEPGLKRMNFDQNDDHPTDVFVKLEATFSDNVKTVIKKNKEN